MNLDLTGDLVIATVPKQKQKKQVDEYKIMHTYIIDNHEYIESVIYCNQLKHKGVKLDNTWSKIQKFSLSVSCLTGQLFRDLRDRCRAAQAYLIGYRMQS